MTSESKILREALVGLAEPGALSSQASSVYTGSPHEMVAVTTPALRRLAKGWLAARKGLAASALLAVLDDLFAGDRHQEKTLAALMVGLSRAARRATTPERVDAWLDSLVGWAEVDSLCSNAFQAEDFLADWTAFGPWLRRLASDPNINKRRASLVLLTGPVRRSSDPRLLQLALTNVATLQHERPILITKAVSWLLRSLTARHREALTAYLEASRELLPAIAVREVTTKLTTGRKTRARARPST